MTIDKARLEALAEAFPDDLDFDSNTEPFFNGPTGESLGGGSTGFYAVYGQPFEIDGEQYDGTEYVGVCTKDFAEFVCSARAGVLALLTEIEQGDSRLHDVAVLCATVEQERDQLKAENAGLKTGYEAYERENAELRAENGALRQTLEDCADSLHAEMLQKFHGELPEDMHPVTRREYDRDMAELAGYRAAMSKEAGHE